MSAVIRKMKDWSIHLVCNEIEFFPVNLICYLFVNSRPGEGDTRACARWLVNTIFLRAARNVTFFWFFIGHTS